MALDRFIEAQERDYGTALTEIKNGRKRSHWMWYIFPQIQGLGSTDTSKFYAIKNLTEASEYLSHPILGKRLIKITEALLANSGNDAHAIFGSPDDLKLKSCMTLFDAVPGAPNLFRQVLGKFYGGQKDQRTLQLLGINN
ncbi:DUF1810 domain-containing protein [Mucilaginibacter pallidiroseus]|uniref:DUF1810 domain-containing protein n=1 Tax=Mucilaginibacter pallidiroseus TaxID=2599295 RepID=A0A563UC11_9SPHI|nr:DUF1810 domain-containing protein [Mucilaginibacter pallidiroseus]TWR28911.1 DUF1810 domain-containing protein [Mucilaginibacter pallidiroseus]